MQLRYSPSGLDQRVELTAGVNNVFNTNPPPCVSCSLNNYDPTTYDVPGQFGYIRIAFKMGDHREAPPPYVAPPAPPPPAVEPAPAPVVEPVAPPPPPPPPPPPAATGERGS